MSTTAIQSTDSIQDLAARITKKLDADGDGSLSSAEFSSFLTQFLGTVQNLPQSADTASAATMATQGSAAASRSVVGTMAGFDRGKLADTTHESMKYTIGRILQYYPNTPAGLRDALPEIQQLVPGASIVGGSGDKLDFGSYVDSKGQATGVIDVLEAAGSGGRAWQWAPVG